jgi:hydroxyacylglutathione hydrolase
VLGYLAGGFEAWKNAEKEVDAVNRISASQFAEEFDAGTTKVIDVRKDSEYEAEHVEDAFSRPLAFINEWFEGIDPEKEFYIHCAGGYRSMIAASILKSRGIHQFKEIDGGFKAIAQTQIPTTDFICQSKVF